MKGPSVDEEIARTSSIVSDDAGSVSSTHGSTSSSKKSSRIYSICYAASTRGTKQKKHDRNRSLLQLHKLDAFTRPKPEFDLVPLANLPLSVPKDFVKTLSGSTKPRYASGDLAVLKAQGYAQREQTSDDENDDDDEEHKVLGLICKTRKNDLPAGSGRLVLDDSSEWTAQRLKGGSYEFSKCDEHGLITTARWIVKRSRSLKDFPSSAVDNSTFRKLSEASGDALSPLTAADAGHAAKKFNFSLISPHTRRHPVLAHLTSSKMDVVKSYHAPPSSTDIPALFPDTTDIATSVTRPDPVEMTSALRALITVTAIWIALREGWCLSCSAFRPKTKNMATTKTKAKTTEIKTKETTVQRCSKIAGVQTEFAVVSADVPIKTLMVVEEVSVVDVSEDGHEDENGDGNGDERDGKLKVGTAVSRAWKRTFNRQKC